MSFNGQKPSVQPRSSVIRSDGMERWNAMASSSSAGEKTASTLSPSSGSVQ